MSMFPGAGATVYRNEAGEPLGWDYPSESDDSHRDDPYGAEDDHCDEDADEDADTWDGDEDAGYEDGLFGCD